MNSTETKRIYLTSRDRVTKAENNLVDVTREDGEVFRSVEPRRLFPVSRTDQYITLLDADGTEVAVIRSLSDLDGASRQVIVRSLDDYYLVPHILRILSVTDKYGNLHWEVETDRGIKSFDIRNRNHDIKAYSTGYVRVRDADDNRYIIDDYKKLDRHSRSFLIADI